MFSSQLVSPPCTLHPPFPFYSHSFAATISQPFSHPLQPSGMLEKHSPAPQVPFPELMILFDCFMRLFSFFSPGAKRGLFQSCAQFTGGKLMTFISYFASSISMTDTFENRDTHAVMLLYMLESSGETRLWLYSPAPALEQASIACVKWKSAIRATCSMNTIITLFFLWIHFGNWLQGFNPI